MEDDFRIKNCGVSSANLENRSIHVYISVPREARKRVVPFSTHLEVGAKCRFTTAANRSTFDQRRNAFSAGCPLIAPLMDTRTAFPTRRDVL